MPLKRFIRGALHALGYEIHRLEPFREANPDVTDAEWKIWQAMHPHSLASEARTIALIRAVEHIVNNRIAGDMVECGVWRGGSSMTMALALLECGDRARDLYLYDTFEGMTAPTSDDVDYAGSTGASQLSSAPRVADEANAWAISPLEDVRRNLAGTGYPPDKVHFVAGPVEQTIPNVAPEKIALLRLDTDWYESTLHELHHLYPRVVSGGIVIIDDYGHWQGAHKAVDEYFAGQSVFLQRIDYTGRLLVKR